MQQIRLFFQSIIVSLVPKSVDFRKYQTEKTDKVNTFIIKKNKFQVWWISKQNIWKEDEGMDVISSKKITEATVVFGRKVSQGSSFKNYGQFNSKFSIAIWCWGCAESPTFLFHSLTLSYGIRWYYLTTPPLFLKIKFNSSFSMREKNN